MRRTVARRLVLVAVIVLALVGGGVVGYYFGREERPAVAPVTYPVWTDQEIQSLGGGSNFATLRCTYHLADGTSRVKETLIVATTTTALAARTCPASP